MNEPHDPNRTVDVPSVPADSLDAGLAAGFGTPAEAPRSSLVASQRPLLLREAKGESDHVVRPHSDAMPAKGQTGDRYLLFGEIARGGMGAVLRGRDVDLGRDLAVKVLLEKHAERPEVARRFLEEAQIGGQLQHPNVVPVYDIGRFGDRPFFTMKLVKGQTLAAILGARANPSEDRPRLLSIALQVTQALAYAHAKGVIHRDLKPANVMVGAFGEVQVMDWGLAKVLAEGGIADEERASRQHQPEEGTLIRTARSSGSAGSGTDTEAGSLLGTPAYMPPEQANGDVANLDRRADVFGLGAILCEILTGKPPYVGRSGEEVRRKAANGDLADATARLDGCGADTELIVLTKACVSAEAIDRPRDAQEVADGLQAYLDGVQLRLRKAELAEAEARARAIEEAKRRRLTLGLAATVLLAVTLGGGAWLWLKNERDARQTRVAREVNDALNQATALRAQAKAANVGASALFAQAREQAQRASALAESGPADETLKEQVRLLQTELDEEEKDRQLLAALDEARLAQADIVVGQSRFSLERAVPLFREALRAYGMPAGEGEPAAVAARIRQRSVPVREGLLAALDEWIDLAASPSLALTEPHLDWLRAVLVAAEPQDGWTRRVRAATLGENDVPRLRAALEEKDEAKRHAVLEKLRKELAKRRAALEKLAEEADVRKLPVRSLTRLADRLRSVKAGASAVRLLRRAQQQYPADFWVNHNLGMELLSLTPPEWEEAVRFLTAAVALRPENPGVHLSLGHALKGQGKVEEAIAWHKKAIALDPKYAGAHNNLGAILCDVKHDYDGAVACFRKAIALDPKFANAHNNLGKALRAKGQVDEAIACYRKAIEHDPKHAGAHTGLGNALSDKGKVDEAIACYRQAIALNPKDALAHTNLGGALYRKGKLDEAIACFRQAIALNPKDAKAHTGLGYALYGKGKVDEAIACYRQAIALGPKLAQAHSNLGNALAAKGQVEEAIACHRQAIALGPKLALAHYNLGVVLHGKGQVDEAIACYRKAIALGLKLALAHYNLGNALAAKGQVDEAIACYRQAIALDPKNAGAHNNLGAALCDGKRDYDGAIACFRRGIALSPKDAMTHSNLGNALRGKGQLDEAIVCYQKAIALNPQHPWARNALAQAKRAAAVRDKLPAFQNGSYTPATSAERLGLAEWCQIKKLHRTAAGLYTTAFIADPKLADDLNAGHRYSAACSAALAAAGQGEEAAKLDKERARLRKQALDWLRADLAPRRKQLKSWWPGEPDKARAALAHWQKDGDLAGIRDKAALAKLPAEERAACVKLWSDVAALLKKAEEKSK